MRIPVVLPTVVVTVSPDGLLDVSVDGAVYDPGQVGHGDENDVRGALRRGDLREVLAEITALHQTPVRVEVQEADGTTYDDIVAPPPEPSETPESREPPAVSAVSAVEEVPDDTATRTGLVHGVAGGGFRAGEEVAIVYVLTRLVAAPDGTTAVRLPPALLASLGAGRREGLMLVGLASGVVAPVAGPA